MINSRYRFFQGARPWRMPCLACYSDYDLSENWISKLDLDEVAELTARTMGQAREPEGAPPHAERR